MADYYELNCGLVLKRWPVIFDRIQQASIPAVVEQVASFSQETIIINGIHLSSCFDRAKDAWLQSQLVPDEASSAWVYGAGSGDLPRELLKRGALEQLNVVLLNPAVFKESIKYFDHQDWLADARVELHLAEGMKEINTPFCTSPACLKLAEPSVERLRDLVVLELETPYINSKVRSNKEFMRQISDNVNIVAHDHDVAELFDSEKEKTIIVAAAGPSLEEQFELLKARDMDQTYLIAVDAVLRTLVSQEIYPDCVVTLDGVRDHVFKFFDLDLSAFNDRKLVYFPIVHNDVLTMWPGQRYAAFTSSPMYDEIRKKYSKSVLYASGTVFHAAVDLAVKMGANNVVLMGADFGFPGGWTHVKGAWHRNIAEHYQDVYGTSDKLIDGRGNELTTTSNFRGYLRDLERYILSCDGVNFVNASRSGARIEGTCYLDENRGLL